MTPDAVRTQCQLIYKAGLAGDLEHFRLQLDGLSYAADVVVETIRKNYPSLEVPPHSRWRHFSLDGQDLWAELADKNELQGLELLRCAVELVVISVLLDAGAGNRWHFFHKTSGRKLSRSEGLAIASLELFQSNILANAPTGTLRVDGCALRDFNKNQMAEAYQVTTDNPLVGIEGRVHMLNKLGELVMTRSDMFGTERPRLGNMADYLISQAQDHALSADKMLMILLDAFAPIWPSRTTLASRPLGDTWRHPKAIAGNAADTYVPFHKLSQWLAYSLVEPFEAFGITITGLSKLTGLAEYRNGGLFVDTGTLELIDPEKSRMRHHAGSELIVEWRALTVCLLDAVAELVRNRLDRMAASLPLTSILEGGTWHAGRRLAAERRTGGPPPLQIESDGSIF